MIKDILAPLTVQEAAQAMANYYDNPQDSWAAARFADILYEGVYLPQNLQRAIDIYCEVINKNDIEAAKLENISLRTVDYFLNLKCFSLASKYVGKLSWQSVALLLENFQNLKSRSCIAFCNEALFKLLKDKASDHLGKISTDLIIYFCSNHLWSKTYDYIPTANLSVLPNEELNALAEHCHAMKYSDLAVICLEALLNNNYNPNFKTSILLVHSLCNLKLFPKAASVFSQIPHEYLSENTIYMGIAAMTAAGGYDDEIIRLCYEVCTQYPQAAKVKLYAKQLENACLKNCCYKQAKEWAAIAGDENIKEQLAIQVKTSNSQNIAVYATLGLLTIAIPFLPLLGLGPIPILYKNVSFIILALLYVGLFINSIRLLNKKLTINSRNVITNLNGKKSFLSIYLIFFTGVFFNGTIAYYLGVRSSLLYLLEVAICFGLIIRQHMKGLYPIAMPQQFLNWKDFKILISGTLVGIVLAVILRKFVPNIYNCYLVALLTCWLTCSLFSLISKKVEE
jgi:hypothetical protein